MLDLTFDVDRSKGSRTGALEKGPDLARQETYVTIPLLQELLSILTAVLEDELGHLFIGIEAKFFGQKSELDVRLVPKK